MSPSHITSQCREGPRLLPLQGIAATQQVVGHSHLVALLGTEAGISLAQARHTAWSAPGGHWKLRQAPVVRQ